MRVHRRSLVGVLAVMTVVLACTGRPRAQSGRRSPHESTSATIDGAQMSIEYGRPSVRGREIFGRLVRWDDVWCPGADECTRLTTSRALKIRELSVPAGEYTLWMLPTEDVWTLIVNRNAFAFHTNYRSRDDLGRVRLDKRALDELVEQLTFSIDKAPSGPGGRIVMKWEKTEVMAPFTVE
jgi:hypothetical protein